MACAGWAEDTLRTRAPCACSALQATFLVYLQGHRVAELILHHARANECKDVERFKAEMATLVTQARKNTLTLEKVGRHCVFG